MNACARCGGSVEPRYRFCPWCSAPLRLKLVEFFRPHGLIADDRGKALRISRYFGGAADESHVRFSVWTETDGRAEATAAVSLDEDESRRVAAFLLESCAEPARAPTLGRLLEQLRR